MSRKNWIVIGGLAILPPVAWYLISPLFIDEKVDEAFPPSQSKQRKLWPWQR